MYMFYNDNDTCTSASVSDLARQASGSKGTNALTFLRDFPASTTMSILCAQPNSLSILAEG